MLESKIVEFHIGEKALQPSEVLTDRLSCAQEYGLMPVAQIICLNLFNHADFDKLSPDDIGRFAASLDKALLYVQLSNRVIS